MGKNSQLGDEPGSIQQFGCVVHTAGFRINLTIQPQKQVWVGPDNCLEALLGDSSPK